jgi:hypothetical protein
VEDRDPVGELFGLVQVLRGGQLAYTLAMATDRRTIG